jgi:hypothetical protein
MDYADATLVSALRLTAFFFSITSAGPSSNHLVCSLNEID